MWCVGHEVGIAKCEVQSVNCKLWSESVMSGVRSVKCKV